MLTGAIEPRLHYLRARYYNPANARFNRLDPFSGNMQDPQSLHKYAYVHGDPVQFTDPSGTRIIGAIVRKMLGNGAGRIAIETSVWAITKALIGIRAGRTLGNAYVKEMGRDPSDVNIDKAIARKGDLDLPIDQQAENYVEQMKKWLIRPDIVDHTAGDEQFYEIKSIGQKAAGLVEVGVYAAQLALRYPGKVYSPGNWNPRQSTYYIDFAYGIPVPLKIRAWNDSAGLIVYKSDGNEDAVLAALIATEVAFAIAEEGAKRLAASGAAANGQRGQTGVVSAMNLSILVGF